MTDSALIRELNLSGEIVYTTVGVSMKPMLRSRRDTVHIKKNDSVLKKYDLPLYVRPNGQLVLHRILDVCDGFYIIRGDNCYNSEKVPFDCTVGVVDSFWRGKIHFSCSNALYKFYVRFWCLIFPLRKALYILKQKIKHIIKK